MIPKTHYMFNASFFTVVLQSISKSRVAAIFRKSPADKSHQDIVNELNAEENERRQRQQWLDAPVSTCTTSLPLSSKNQ